MKYTVDVDVLTRKVTELDAERRRLHTQLRNIARLKQELKGVISWVSSEGQAVKEGPTE